MGWRGRWLSFPRQRGVRNGRLVRPAFSFLIYVLSMTHELDVQRGEAGDMGGGVWMVFVLMRAFYQREPRIYEKLGRW